MSTLREYYNNKYPKAPITYEGRYVMCAGEKVKYTMDVRDFISANNVILKDFVSKLLRGVMDEEEKVLRILYWVQDNLTYTPDSITGGVDEFWQLPMETFTTRKGDCEDGGILIASLLLNAGIPAYRVRVTAGLVKSGAAAETGGHAWCTYTEGEEDDNRRTIILDWCYNANRLPFAERLAMKDDPNYLEIWFSWNQQFAWANKPIHIDE